MKKLFSAVLCAGLILCMFGCNTPQEPLNESNSEISQPEESAEERSLNESAKETAFFQAAIIEITNGAIFVRPLEGRPQSDYSDKISINTENVPTDADKLHDERRISIITNKITRFFILSDLHILFCRKSRISCMSCLGYGKLHNRL